VAGCVTGITICNALHENCLPLAQSCLIYNYPLLYYFRGRNSSAGTTTCCGLNGPGSNPGGARFSAHIQTDPGAHPPSYTMGNGSFPGVKAAGAWCSPFTPFSAEVKERVGLYLYFPPLWAFVACSGVNCTLFCIIFCFYLFLPSVYSKFIALSDVALCDWSCRTS